VKVARSALAPLAVAPVALNVFLSHVPSHPSRGPGGRLGYRLEEPLYRLENMIIDRTVGIRRVPRGDGVDSAPT
jgi:hypothetical protein